SSPVRTNRSAASRERAISCAPAKEKSKRNKKCRRATAGTVGPATSRPGRRRSTTSSERICWRFPSHWTSKSAAVRPPPGGPSAPVTLTGTSTSDTRAVSRTLWGSLAAAQSAGRAPRRPASEAAAKNTLRRTALHRGSFVQESPGPLDVGAKERGGSGGRELRQGAARQIPISLLHRDRSQIPERLELMRVELDGSLPGFDCLAVSAHLLERCPAAVPRPRKPVVQGEGLIERRERLLRPSHVHVGQADILPGDRILWIDFERGPERLERLVVPSRRRPR